MVTGLSRNAEAIEHRLYLVFGVKKLQFASPKPSNLASFRWTRKMMLGEGTPRCESRCVWINCASQLGERFLEVDAKLRPAGV